MHFRQTDVEPAVLSNGHGLAVTVDVIRLDADGMPVAGRDLEDDFRVAHQVAVLLSVMIPPQETGPWRNLIDHRQMLVGRLCARRNRICALLAAQD
jgi:hypothetical protein